MVLNFTYLDIFVISHNAMKFEERQTLKQEEYEKNSDTTILEHKSINNGIFKSGPVLILLFKHLFSLDFQNDIEFHIGKDILPCIIFSLVSFAFANMDYFLVYCTYGLVKFRKFFTVWEKTFYFSMSFIEMGGKVILYGYYVNMYGAIAIGVLFGVELIISILVTFYQNRNFDKP